MSLGVYDTEMIWKYRVSLISEGTLKHWTSQATFRHPNAAKEDPIIKVVKRVSKKWLIWTKGNTLAHHYPDQTIPLEGFVTSSQTKSGGVQRNY